MELAARKSLNTRLNRTHTLEQHVGEGLQLENVQINDQKESHSMKSVQSFFENFGSASKNTMNLSMYNDGFLCACGETHWFDSYISVLCQGFWKIVVFCPNDPNYLTSLKIKTFLGMKFKGFQTLDTTHVSTEEDRITLIVLKNEFS